MADSAPLVCVLKKGSAVRAGLDAVLRAHDVRTGAVAGIGALEQAEIGFYDLAAREYRRSIVPEIVELVSFLGNVSWVDGEPFVHAHAVLGRPDFSLLGGHFFDGIVAITGEFSVWPGAETVTRAYDAETGLKLIAPGAGPVP